MLRLGKVWGATSPLFAQNNVEVHRIAVNKGGYSSRHYHAAKYNLFFVEIGRLEISQWPDGKTQDKTILEEGESCSVPPSVEHGFKALTDVVAYEIYWTSIDPEDIKRLDQGGIEGA